MAFAMAFPNRQQGKRSDLLLEATGSDKKDYDKSTLSRARYVLRNNPVAEGQKYPQRCLDVMAGAMTLTQAYDETQKDVAKREEEARINQS
jgi:hypothetical protein